MKEKTGKLAKRHHLKMKGKSKEDICNHIIDKGLIPWKYIHFFNADTFLKKTKAHPVENQAEVLKTSQRKIPKEPHTHTPKTGAVPHYSSGKCK